MNQRVFFPLLVVVGCAAPVGDGDEDKVADESQHSCAVDVIDNTDAQMLLSWSGPTGRALRTELGTLGYEVTSIVASDDYEEGSASELRVMITEGCDGLRVDLQHQNDPGAEWISVDTWYNSPGYNCDATRRYVAGLAGESAFEPLQNTWYVRKTLVESFVSCERSPEAIMRFYEAESIEQARLRIWETHFLTSINYDSDHPPWGGIEVSERHEGITQAEYLQGMLRLEQAIEMNNQLDPLTGQGVYYWDHSADYIMVSDQWWRGMASAGLIGQQNTYKIRFDASPLEMLRQLARMTGGELPQPAE